MFRRRLDPNWLILITLFALFVFVARMPGRWERVARSEAIVAIRAVHTPPAIVSEPSTETAETAVAATETYRRMEPVAKVGSLATVVTPLSLDRAIPLPALSTIAAEIQPAQPASLLAQTVSTAPVSLGPRSSDDVAEVAYPDTGLPAVSPKLPQPVTLKVLELSKPAAPDWQQPEALLGGLDELAKHETTRAWADNTRDLLRKLGPAASSGSKETGVILSGLAARSAESGPLASRLKDSSLGQEFSRVRHALQRRLSVWKNLRTDGLAAKQQAPAVDSRSMSLCLAQIDSLTGDSREGEAWRKYLMVDAIDNWMQRRKTADERMPSDLAQALLKRLNQVRITAEQRKVLESAPVAALRTELLRQTAQPIDSRRLLAHLERYERTGLPSEARLLANDYQYLAVASTDDGRQLANRLDTHYRNANLRLAVTAELLNRLIPPGKPEYARVDDTVLGMPVWGDSTTAHSLAVRLLPDHRRVLLALEVRGQVEAQTTSASGPATFYSDNQSNYVALKPMEVNLQGIRLGETEVDVSSDLHLQRINTDFDRVPVIGSIVRKVAQSQHDERLPEAEEEVKQKIAAKAQERIDREATAQARRMAQLVQQKVLGPINDLMLDPTMIAGETTQQRFIMRVRLAGRDQLGAHTPRPQAPADSLASLQVHESAVNNVLQRLELDGQTFTLPNLARHIAWRLNRPEPKPIDPDQEDVKVTFAAQDAVRVRCLDGRVEVSMAVAKLSKSPRHWKDFQVRAFYRPQIDGRLVQMARDGVVRLSGARLSTGAQIALRGVFAKVFSEKAPWQLTPEQLAKNPKLDGLTVTQLVINDGWIGVAVGPQRTAVVRQASLVQ
jgi:hypothetical protein